MKFKKIILFQLLIILLFTSGCWDKIETSNREFIALLVFDINEEAMKEQDTGKNVFCEEKPKIVKISFGLVNPSKLQSGDKAFVERTITGVNLADAVEGLAASSSRKPFFGHTTLAVFTERFASNPVAFRDALDELERNPIINRQMKIAFFTGDSSEALKIEPKLENLIAGYVAGIMQNSDILSSTVDMDLGGFLTFLRNGEGRTLMPVLSMKEGGKGDVEVKKLALINNYQLYKIVDTKYIRSYKILTNKMKRGRKIIDYKGFSVPYAIASSRRVIYLDSSNEKLKYTVKVEFEGDIEEFNFDQEIFKMQVIDDLKNNIEDSMKQELLETTKYFQNDIGYDYLGLKDYTHKYHSKVYEKYKDNWDQAFKDAEINYEVKVNIRRIGATKK
jgi:Ger(x)C family germination protein